MGWDLLSSDIRGSWSPVRMAIGGSALFPPAPPRVNCEHPIPYHRVSLESIASSSASAVFQTSCCVNSPGSRGKFPMTISNDYNFIQSKDCLTRATISAGDTRSSSLTLKFEAPRLTRPTITSSSLVQRFKCKSLRNATASKFRQSSMSSKRN